MYADLNSNLGPFQYTKLVTIATILYIYRAWTQPFQHILSFLKEEGFSAAHAKFLGTHLNLPRATIKTMKKNNADDANGLLFDIIDNWLDQTEPSWEELARALDKCDYRRIARKCEF